MTTESVSSKSTSKGMNIFLWILQFLIALILVMAGGMKLSSPISELSTQIPWAGQVPEMFVRLTAVVDLLGAVGLIVPGVTKIKPILVAWAAVGVMALMLSAIGFHLMRGEGSVIGFNVVILLLSAIVAWGRFVKAPLHRS